MYSVLPYCRVQMLFEEYIGQNVQYCTQNALIIIIMPAFACLVSLTSVLFKECLHMAIQSTTLFPPLSYVYSLGKAGNGAWERG